MMMMCRKYKCTLGVLLVWPIIYKYSRTNFSTKTVNYLIYCEYYIYVHKIFKITHISFKYDIDFIFPSCFSFSITLY